MLRKVSREGNSRKTQCVLTLDAILPLIANRREMNKPDLNLLYVLDALLKQRSIVNVARKFELSQSAMSRSASKLRATMGDQLLVRAGSKFVLTPRAKRIQNQVDRLLRELEDVLRPVEDLNPEALKQTFTVRSGEGFVETFGPRLISCVRKKAPGVELRFINKIDSGGESLRAGTVDLEAGVVSDLTAPEIRVKGLFRDRFIGVVRTGHKLDGQKVCLEDFIAGDHIAIHREGLTNGPVDRALAKLEKSRSVSVAVTGFSTALSLCRGSDFIATVPERSTMGLRQGLYSFPLPFPAPEVMVSLMWHPRLDDDPAHRWLRGQILHVCNAPETDR